MLRLECVLGRKCGTAKRVQLKRRVPGRQIFPAGTGEKMLLLPNPFYRVR